MKKSFVILSLVFLASCAHKIVKPSQSDVDRGAAKFPGLTVAQLEEGKALYDTKCVLCHAAKNPRSWTEAQWRKIVPNMVDAARQHKKADITPTEQESILRYVVTMSGR